MVLYVYDAKVPMACNLVALEPHFYYHYSETAEIILTLKIMGRKIMNFFNEKI